LMGSSPLQICMERSLQVDVDPAAVLPQLSSCQATEMTRGDPSAD
jgi:hypothetical protein